MTAPQGTWTTTTGRQVGEDDAAQLAEQFEYDKTVPSDAQVRFPRRVRAGRPSLTPAGSTSPQVTFRLSAELRASAERVAAQRGTTVSGLAREALEELPATAPNQRRYSPPSTSDAPIR